MKHYFITNELDIAMIKSGKIPYNKIIQYKYGSEAKWFKSFADKVDSICARFKDNEITFEEVKELIIKETERRWNKFPERFEEDGVGWYDKKMEDE